MSASTNRSVRLIALLIVAKLALVVVNVGMAMYGAPAAVRLAGIGLQLALTIALLALLFKLASGGRRG